MQVTISSTHQACGQAAAICGATRIREAIKTRDRANIIVATGASQFKMIETLVADDSIAWNKVTVFHLDEYIGIPITHPASFRMYLWERFHRKLPCPLHSFHYIAGDESPDKECERLGALIASHPIDVCFAGIGENAHLAFNDPPADFETEIPYLIVDLDEACRKQQSGEGWFNSLDEVPRKAISMSIRQILKARSVVITAPDVRKAPAIRDSIEGPVTSQVPASILQQHSDTHVFLDPASASLLSRVNR